jgi:4a-hydroxytetrahydrobiopterin dehydratase
MARLSDEEIDAGLARLNGWSRNGEAITKEFKRDDFVGSVQFVNAITPVAEEMNHHPDLAISWNTVTVTISTHSEGGLTQNDFELAEKIDALG